MTDPVQPRRSGAPHGSDDDDGDDDRPDGVVGDFGDDEQSDKGGDSDPSAG